MIKAKAKADRAAARQANSSGGAASSATPAASAPSPQPSPAQEPAAVESGSTDTQAQDIDEALPPVPPKEPALDRTDLLRSKPAVVGRFMELMVPILVDVYAASVITPVRVKTLTGLLKAASFLDGDGLKRVLIVR